MQLMACFSWIALVATLTISTASLHAAVDVDEAPVRSSPSTGRAVERVQFIVVTPDITDAQPAEIHLASSANGWKPDGPRLRRVGDGIYVGSFKLSPGPLAYKFTRTGTWKTVEKAAGGAELPNRQLIVPAHGRPQSVVCVVAAWADRAPGCAVAWSKIATPPNQPAEHTLTGDIRSHNDFHSPQLGNARTLIVYLPPGYDAHPNKRYPVLYMHDGNNIFDAATSFSGVEWKADETAQRLIEAGEIPPMIIVGIYNNAQRHIEYTPHADAEHGGGLGGAYLKFIVDTVKPFIDRTYRTKPEREHTAMAGSSLGGVISLYAAYEHADVFGSVAVISPALWWADAAMLGYVAQRGPQQPVRMWLDVGTEERERLNEKTGGRYVEDTRRLVRVLEDQGWERGGDFVYVEVDGGGHHESDWAARFDDVLRFLFAPAGQRE